MSAHLLNDENSLGSSHKRCLSTSLGSTAPLELLFRELKQEEEQVREREEEQFIATDLFDCEPWKVHDTVLHHLHPPAVFV